MKLFVTGGAGFIGSALIRHLVLDLNYEVVNIDKLTYAGNLDSLKILNKCRNYHFEKFDICDAKNMTILFNKYKPDKVVHLAAESHVDKSLTGPSDFVKTNIFGTYTLLEAARIYYSSIKCETKKRFLFHHVSTDEVYGDLGSSVNKFTENTKYDPSSPYSATKASSDHLVRAWGRSYGLPVIISNCSNNYGPYQLVEKLIPLVISKALNLELIPVYGDGSQIRDWLYVDDHVKALTKVFTNGKIGDSYNIGGNDERKNLDVVKQICLIMDELYPCKSARYKSYAELITFVDDRPGHDIKYSVNSSKIQNSLKWSPQETFETGLLKTIKWYVKNQHFLFGN